MFTAWSEIKYLATKELLSLPNMKVLTSCFKSSPSGMMYCSISTINTLEYCLNYLV